MTVVILVLVLAFVHLDSATATVLFDPGALATVAGAIIIVVERNFSTVGGSEAEAAAVVDDLEAEAATIVEFALELELETEATTIVDCALELELELEAEAVATDCALELEAEAAEILEFALELDAEAAAIVDSVLELAAAAACSEITDLGTTLL